MEKLLCFCYFAKSNTHAHTMCTIYPKVFENDLLSHRYAPAQEFQTLFFLILKFIQQFASEPPPPPTFFCVHAQLGRLYKKSGEEKKIFQRMNIFFFGGVEGEKRRLLNHLNKGSYTLNNLLSFDSYPPLVLYTLSRVFFWNLSKKKKTFFVASAVFFMENF